jgi:hypothetical protein
MSEHRRTAAQLRRADARPILLQGYLERGGPYWLSDAGGIPRFSGRGGLDPIKGAIQCGGPHSISLCIRTGFSSYLSLSNLRHFSLTGILLPKPEKHDTPPINLQSISQVR